LSAAVGIVGPIAQSPLEASRLAAPDPATRIASLRVNMSTHARVVSSGANRISGRVPTSTRSARPSAPRFCQSSTRA
jgi:hypothetical protein